jgi:hypothetical protein
VRDDGPSSLIDSDCFSESDFFLRGDGGSLLFASEIGSTSESTFCLRGDEGILLFLSERVSVSESNFFLRGDDGGLLVAAGSSSLLACTEICSEWVCGGEVA